MNLNLTGTVDKELALSLKLHIALFLLLHAGVHRKRSDVSDWTRAWKTSSDGVNSLYMHVNLYLCFLTFFFFFSATKEKKNECYSL